MMWRKALGMLFCLPAALAAQEQANEQGERDSAYVEQAEAASDADASPVYWPERITRSQVDAARTASAQQLTSGDASVPVAQLTGEEGARLVAQLADAGANDPLTQLTERERQVLLEAIKGTDICAQQSQIPAIRQLCAVRLETRSADFRPRSVNTLSPEERLLGEGLGDQRVATLERIIERLGRNGSAQDAQNQAIASVALTQRDVPDPASGASHNGGNLSAEARTLIEAIVEQVPGAGGGPP